MQTKSKALNSKLPLATDVEEKVDYYIDLTFLKNKQRQEHIHIASSTIGGFRAISPILKVAKQRGILASLSLSKHALIEAKNSGILGEYSRINFIPGEDEILPGQSLLPEITATIVTVPVYSRLEVETLLKAKLKKSITTYLVVENWGHPGDPILNSLPNAEAIDHIICSDHFVVRNLRELWPNFCSKKFLTIGSGHTEKIESLDYEKLYEFAAKKIGVLNFDKVYLYLGGALEIEHSRPGIYGLGQSFDILLEEIKKYAFSNPFKKIALLYRPHPSLAAIKANLSKIIQFEKNFKLIEASQEFCSIDEACCVSSIHFGVETTDPFLAKYRMRKGAYLIFNKETQRLLDESKMLNKIRNLDQRQNTFIIEDLLQLKNLLEAEDFNVLPILPKANKFSEELIDIIIQLNQEP